MLISLLLKLKANTIQTHSPVLILECCQLIVQCQDQNALKICFCTFIPVKLFAVLEYASDIAAQ